jgi:hypothetical protein
MKPLFTVAQGYLTKAGVGVGAGFILLEKVINFINGEEFATLANVGQETWASLGVLGSLVITTWGAFRASINYAGKTK